MGYRAHMVELKGRLAALVGMGALGKGIAAAMRPQSQRMVMHDRHARREQRHGSACYELVRAR